MGWSGDVKCVSCVTTIKKQLNARIIFLVLFFYLEADKYFLIVLYLLCQEKMQNVVFLLRIGCKIILTYRPSKFSEEIKYVNW